MDTHRFENNDLQVSRLGSGGMGMGTFFGSTNDEESTKGVQYALDNGIRTL
jgi:aryl-alcohol dehydrogenase-like predicted oxidoreductase